MIKQWSPLLQVIIPDDGSGQIGAEIVRDDVSISPLEGASILIAVAETITDAIDEKHQVMFENAMLFAFSKLYSKRHEFMSYEERKKDDDKH